MSDGIRINNWLTLLSILMISATIVVYSKYVAPKDNPLPAKKQMNSGLKCQNGTTPAGKIVCFDKVYNKALLKEGLELFNSGAYSLQGGLIFSEHMKTKLKDAINIEQSDKMFLNAINITKNDESIKRLNIKYEIIENDKLSPNKKSNSKQCKLYAGYVLTSFRINNKQVYRMQIDFHTYSLQEIQKRINCTIKAFIHNAQI